MLWLFCLEIQGNCTKPADLSDNAVVHHDYIFHSSFSEGGFIKLSCHPGYETASGKARLKCEGGQWHPNPQDFTCKKKTCIGLKDVHNGRYNMTGNDFGSVATVVCNKGYYLIGERRRTCMGTGEWDGQEPTCEVVKCGPPPEIEYGQHDAGTDGDHQYGHVVVYSCKADYTLFGQAESHCTMSQDSTTQEGIWTAAPTCKKVQCPKPNIPNAERIAGSSSPYYYSYSVTYSCKEGFNMVSGEATMVCQENGEWSSTPKCEAVQPSAKSTPRTPVKETITSKDGKNANGSVPAVHSSLWILLAAIVSLAAQNGLFSLIQ